MSAQQDVPATGGMPIPEVAFQVRPTAYFFRLKSPKNFEVARPASFNDMSTFKTIDMDFTVKKGLETVWSQYNTINPLKIWNNARSQIVAVYVPSKDRTLYREQLVEEWSGFEEGMKIFIDMSSLPVAVSNRPAMMVALMIVRLDPAERMVEFRYVEGTPSYGKQIIKFSRSESDPNVTEISHKTWFRSYGALVEQLYSMYHNMMIRGMHERFRWEIETDR